MVIPYSDHTTGIHDSAIAIQPLEGGGGGGSGSGSTGKTNNRNNRKRKKQRTGGSFVSLSTALPYMVDFLPTQNRRRQQEQSSSSSSSSTGTSTDLLLQAVGPKRGIKKKSDNNNNNNNDSTGRSEGAIIHDWTAGFGQDALVLVRGGPKRVHMVEREPIIAILLHDALRRSELISKHEQQQQQQQQQYEQQNSMVATDLLQRLTLQVGDGKMVAKELLSQSSEEEGLERMERPDIVYLDPMFSPRTKSAAVKKAMQILHGVLQTQDVDSADEDRTRQDERELLTAAINVATFFVWL